MVFQYLMILTKINYITKANCNKYMDKDFSSHLSLIVNNCEKITKLIDSSNDGNIRVWNFHSKELLN